jgi:hypothetical protein
VTGPVEKKRKKSGRKRTVRMPDGERRVTYENLNRPSHPPTPRAAEVLGDDGDGDDGQAAVKGAGNPVSQPGGRRVTDRLSPSRVTGGAARSTGDHNDPMAPSGPKTLALGHPDMRFGTTGPVPLLSMRTDSDDFPRDLRGMTSGVPVALARLDAYGAAGAPPFRQQPSGNPAVRHPDHQSRGSATAPNGGHSLTDPQSHAVAMKASEAREVLKRHMFPGSGGVR